jgi:hypothetical protein
MHDSTARLNGTDFPPQAFASRQMQPRVRRSASLPGADAAQGPGHGKVQEFIKLPGVKLVPWYEHSWAGADKISKRLREIRLRPVYDLEVLNPAIGQTGSTLKLRSGDADLHRGV